MKYKVAFMERTDGSGNPSEDPTGYLGLDLPDGVVLDRVFVERTKPENLHVEERMEEDDSFLSVGTEVWEYDVADGRERDFEDAMRNSQMVMEFEQVEGAEP